MPTLRSIPLALLVCAALAGCGSSSNKKDSGSSPKPASTAADTGGGGSTGKAATADIKDFTFTPETVTVAAGGTVTWTNKDSANHNVQFDDKSVKGIANLRQDQSGKVTFAKAGSFSYVCTYHAGMKGTVTVQ
jgi:plastocyanin